MPGDILGRDSKCDEQHSNNCRQADQPAVARTVRPMIELDGIIGRTHFRQFSHSRSVSMRSSAETSHAVQVVDEKME